MCEAQGRAEVRGGQGPDGDSAAGENHGCWAFGQNAQAEECTEKGESCGGNFLVGD